jgi:hypothetical protein
MNVTDLPANMQSKITVNESGCWHWTAAVNSRNYGQVGVDGVSKSTHRITYQLLVGPIPEGLQIDHLCRNTRCCNPEHLEPVTALENRRRRPDFNKSHCVNGHELTVENTIIKLAGGVEIRRNCRTCTKESQRAKRRAGLPISDDRHGKANGYITYGCKCDPCSAAYRDYRAARRAS